MSDITEKQREVISKCFELMREHFDSCVLIFDTEDKDSIDHCFEVSYYGGISAAVGMVERSKNRLLNSINFEEEEDNE